MAGIQWARRLALGAMFLPSLAGASQPPEPCESGTVSAVEYLDVWSEVAPNTRFWLPDGQTPDVLALETEAGEAVPFELTRLADRPGTWGASRAVEILTPSEPLVPGASYRLVTSSDFGTEEATITVLFGDDLDPPPVPVAGESTYPRPVGRELTDAPSPSGSGWRYSFSLDFSTYGDDVALVVLDAGGGEDWDPDLLDGGVFALSEGRIQVGAHRCGANWIGGVPGDELEVRASAVDFAGDWSEWSDPWTLVIDPNCGCSSAASPPASLVALVLALSAATLRRRRVG